MRPAARRCEARLGAWHRDPARRNRPGGTKMTTMAFTEVVETVGTVLDGAGVAVIVVGVLSAVVVAGRALAAHQPGVYPLFRRHLGRSILLGLELLVAADIIRTVAVTPTLGSVAVLAVIVVIRTFLSWSLELEISGRWPWQRDPDAPPTASDAPAANG